MSNAYSVLHNYDIPVQSPDFNLIQSALEYKQNKLDTNRAKVQAVADQFAMLDVAKDVDKEYVDKRLQAVVDITNKYASGDLSSNSLTSSLLQNINQVADDNVKNAVLSTRLYRSEQSEWDKAKKDTPGKYSQLNHAYASQNAGTWLNDQTVGKKYNGGGGFIEYSDYKKKILDALPKQLELIKRKGFQDVDNPDTAIDATNVLEIVDRYKLNGVIDSLLGEKDRAQMRIDAWGTYDKVPDDQLREEWNEGINPKLEQKSDEIESIEATIKNGGLDAKSLEIYKSNLEDRKREKDNLDNSSFENVIGRVGREGLYTSMYQNSFKDNLLNTYSGTTIIDRKVNEVQKANVELEIKLKHLQLAENADRRAQTKADAETALKTGGTGFTTGQDQEIDTNKEKPSIFYKETEAQIGTRNTLINSLEKHLPNTNINQVLNSKDFTVLLNSSLAGKKSINLGGKEIPLNSALRAHIANFKDAFSDNPAKQDAFNYMGASLDEMRKQVATGLKTGNTENYNIPNMNVKYKKMENGEYTLETVPYQQGQNRYAYLLRVEQGAVKDAKGNKVTLTEPGKRDLKLYSALQQLHDGNLNGYQRQLAKEYVLHLTKDVDKNGFNKLDLENNIKNDKGVMPNTYSKVTGQDLWFSEYGKGDINSNAFSRLQEGVVGTTSGLVTGALANVVGAFGVEEKNNPLVKLSESLYGTGENEDKSKGTDKIQNSMFKNIQTSLDHYYSDNYNMGSNRTQVLERKGNEEKYKDIAKRLGVESTSTRDIMVTQKLDDGVPVEGRLIVTMRPKEGAKAETLTEIQTNGIEIPTSELKGVVEFDVKRPKYDATYKNPRVIDLGNGYYGGMESKGLALPARTKLLETVADEGGDANIANNLLEKYKQGNYSVKLVSDGTIYGFRVFNADGTSLADNAFVVPMAQILKEGEVAGTIDDPKASVDDIMFKYIKYKSQR